MVEQDAHREFAVEFFNGVWTLLENNLRTRAEDDDMLNAAHASRYHWSKAKDGTPQNLAIGEWQIARVYAVLQRAEPALYHAQRCLEICQANGVGGFARAYASEALARAAALAGNAPAAARFIRQGKDAGDQIKEEDDRKQFFNDLKTVPGYGDA